MFRHDYEHVYMIFTWCCMMPVLKLVLYDLRIIIDLQLLRALKMIVTMFFEGTKPTGWAVHSVVNRNRTWSINCCRYLLDCYFNDKITIVDIKQQMRH